MRRIWSEPLVKRVFTVNKIKLIIYEPKSQIITSWFCPMHFDIIDGKIWIQRNMTEIDVAEALIEQGVSKSDIVLGFLSPKMREYSDYAIA